MRKILTISQCEFMEMLKTKTFLVSVLFAPLIMGGILFFANKLTTQPAGPRPPLKLGITDLTGRIEASIRTSIDDYNRSNPGRTINVESIPAGPSADTANQAGKDRLRSGAVNAYIVIDQDAIAGKGRITLFTYKPKPADTDIFWTAEDRIISIVIEERCKIQNIPPSLLREIRSVPVERIEIGDSADSQKVQSQADMMTRMMVPFFFMFLIYMGIMVIGQQILSSIIEEKSSRIIEIILSAVSPFELMAGKILGLSAIGLLVMALWAGTAYGTARWQGMAVDVSGGMFVYLVVYFILGFLFYGAVMAGVGSICTTIKESQSLMTPMVMMCILPMISWFNLVQSPNGLFARVLSYIPPVTPLVMVLRLSSTSDVPIIEVILSILVMVLSVLAAIWCAAKVFRTGILMYGKRPSLREVTRWFRQH